MRISFIKKLLDFAERDEDIILLTGDLGFSVFEDFKKKFPKQFLNVGVSEQCMIGMAAGLALEGKKVFVYSIIPFLIYRAFEQIRNDLCYQRLAVKLIGVGSGIVYGGQGGTHHAIEDLGVMINLPDMMVFAPGDPLEVDKIMEYSLYFDKPCYIRLNKAGDAIVNTTETINFFEIGKPLKIKGSEKVDINIIGVGNVLPLAVDIFYGLEKIGVCSSVYSMHTLKPYNPESLKEILKTANMVVTIEEHIERNVLGCIVNSHIPSGLYPKIILNFGLDDCFIHKVGKQDFLRDNTCLNKSNIIDTILKYL